MSAPKDPPIPLRIPPELLTEIDAVSTSTGLSKQDIMRLCMRIGLVDLCAAEHDFPGIVKKIADDKGVSFQQYAKQIQKGQLAESKQHAPPIEPRFEVKEIISASLQSEASLIEKPTGDLQKSPACAPHANSNADSPGSSQLSSSEEETAGIVRLSPPQFVELGKQLPSLVAEKPPAAATKKKRKLGGGND